LTARAATLRERKREATLRLSPPPACGCKSNLMVETGVSVMTAGGMGQGAAPILGENGIKVARGAAGPVREAIRNRLDGRTPDSLEVRRAQGNQARGGRWPTAPREEQWRDRVFVDQR
jgi:predicted Fe-Mo cluster-binding NifX family protein